MKYITVILILFLINCSPKNNDGEIKVNYNGDSYNFGKIIQSDTLRTKFHFRNDLDKNIEIEKLYGSSKQIQVTSNKKVLKPKEVAIINVEFFTKGLNGAQKRQISIKTDNEKEPYIKYYIKAYVYDSVSYKRDKLYNSIINKKESYHDLPTKVNISRKYSKEEIKKLNIDTTKTREEVTYELIKAKFLKSKLKNFKFTTYYVSHYMSDLSKILRVENEDTLYNIVLASRAGNGLDFKTLSSEFINDSIFIKTKVNNKCKKDDQNQIVYDIDSIVFKYKYSLDLRFRLIQKDTFNILKEITVDSLTGKKSTRIEHFNTLGKIGNTEIVYSISYISFSSNLPEYLTFYLKSSKKELFKMEFGGAYIGELELFNINDNYFIYVSADETSGIRYGSYWSLDLNSNKANRVIEDFGNFKIPDSLDIYKGFGILKNSENQFYSGLQLRSKNDGSRYMLKRTHKLIKKEKNVFVLKVVNNELTGGQY